MNHLGLEERIKINEYVKKNKSFREIGRILGRSHTTITREFRRNSHVSFGYQPHQAHRIATKRTHTPRIPSKISSNPHLCKYILSKLEDLRWSPALISQVLRRENTPLLGRVSHETIYSWIYKHAPEYTQYFLTKHTKRKKRYGRKSHSHITRRTSIHQRPDLINDRTKFGHWESDTVEFSKKLGYLSVQVERSTGYISIRKVPNKTAEKTLFALQQTRKDLPVFSVTFDNGTEGAYHYKLGVPTYFCDPYASWQKGLVEYSNRLIRLFFPRNINPQSISHADVAKVQFLINSRPRKNLNYLAPIDCIPSGAFGV